MAIAGQGDQVCVVTTEHTLLTDTTAGTFVLHLDLVNSADGGTPDIFEVSVYTIVRSSGGTERLKHRMTVAVGSLSEKIWQSQAYREEVSIKFTLKQVQGSGGRTVPWRVDRM